jgi:hypothetical protein
MASRPWNGRFQRCMLTLICIRVNQTESNHSRLIIKEIVLTLLFLPTIINMINFVGTVSVVAWCSCYVLVCHLDGAVLLNRKKILKRRCEWHSLGGFVSIWVVKVSQEDDTCVSLTGAGTFNHSFHMHHWRMISGYKLPPRGRFGPRATRATALGVAQIPLYSPFNFS